jgi:hypothetical protein
MKIKVTDKVKGEIVISCLGGSLKKGDTLVLDAIKSSHSDVLWAVHHGYLEIVEKPANQEPMGDVVCFINATNRTLTGKMFSKPLDPARSIVVKKSDFIFNDLMRMVDSGKLKIQNLPSEVATDFKKSKDDADSAVREETKTRASFSKKKTSKSAAKEKAEPNVDLYASSKDNSSKNTKYKDGVTSLDIKEPIFVDMNGEVS